MKLRSPRIFPAGAFTEGSAIERIERVLDALPDADLIDVLEKQTSNGRPRRHPADGLWRALIMGILLGHRYVANMLAELRRNDRLRVICGLGPSEDAPREDEMSRFVKRLAEHQDKIDAIFVALVRAVREYLPDFGKQLAQDSTHLRTFSRGKKDPAESSDPEATWGVKAKRRQRPDGSSYESVFKWFGYKLHLLVDSEHELPVAYTVTSASEDDAKQLIPCVRQAQDTLSPPPSDPDAERDTFFEDVPLAADKAYDDTDIYKALHEDFAIKPVIDMRHATADNGTVYDRDRNTRVLNGQTGEFRDLRFLGYEKDRQSLKYGCPCDGVGPCPFFGARCNKPSGGPGAIIRIKLADNYRYYTAIPRESKKWDREYDRRTAVERVNARVKQVLDLEYTGFRGEKKVRLRASLGLVAMLAHAFAALQAQQPANIRSMAQRAEAG